MSSTATKRPREEGEENSHQVNLALAGETIVSAGVLVWDETEDRTQWITKKDWKAIVTANGGKVGTAVNSKTTLVVKGDVFKGDDWLACERAVVKQSPEGRKAGPLKVQSFDEFLNSRPAIQEAVRAKLSSAHWSTTMEVYDKASQTMVTRPNPSYKTRHERTDRVLQAALMHQGRAEAADY